MTVRHEDRRPLGPPDGGGDRGDVGRIIRSRIDDGDAAFAYEVCAGSVERERARVAGAQEPGVGVSL
jgi:hypothetical protein